VIRPEPLQGHPGLGPHSQTLAGSSGPVLPPSPGGSQPWVRASTREEPSIILRPNLDSNRQCKTRLKRLQAALAIDRSRACRYELPSPRGVEQ
jgi:hypothetical protein